MCLRQFVLLTLLLCVVWVIPPSATAQQLVYAEYYIDTDPGEGNGISIQPCDGVFDETSEEFCVGDIPVPDLPDGPHLFCLRLKDSNNRWGSRRIKFYAASSSPYAAKTLLAAEYFIDTDPGEGFGTPLATTDGLIDNKLEHLIADAIESENLSPGPHILFARVMDSYNVRGEIRRVPFRVIEALPYRALVEAEYYIDTDPGEGNGIPLEAADGAFDESLEPAGLAGIDIDNLCPGDHTVYTRFRDNGSQWPERDGWGPVKSAALRVEGPPCPPATVTATPDCERIELTWSPSPTTTRYEISRDGTFLANVTSSEYIDVITDPLVHTYTIRAGNGYGLGEMSQPASASAFLPPPPIELVSPADGAVNRPVSFQICWDTTGSRNAALFHLEVSRDISFTGALVADLQLTGICHQLTGLKKGRDYYWRVRGSNDCGWGDWSETRQFTTMFASISGQVFRTCGETPLGPLNEAAVILRLDSLGADFRVDTTDEDGQYSFATLMDTACFIYIRKGADKSVWVFTLPSLPDDTVGLDLFYDECITDCETETDNRLPDNFALEQNYPNPFNPDTRIQFALPRAADISLEVYNIMGQKVRTLAARHLRAGVHEVAWDSRDESGRRVSSGIYFYRLKTPVYETTRKMILLK